MLRETLQEAGSTLVARNDTEVFLREGDGPVELWAQNDDYAGYTIEVDGIGHEFVRTASPADLLGATLPDGTILADLEEAARLMS